MFLQRFLSHLAAKLSARQSELDSAQALAKHSPRGSHESHTLWLEKAIHTIQGSHPTQWPHGVCAHCKIGRFNI